MTNGNEPISPTPIAGGDNSVVASTHVSSTFEGLTKREYFAALAMQAVISGVYSSKDAYNSFIRSGASISGTAVKEADKLIRELNRTEE